VVLGGRVTPIFPVAGFLGASAAAALASLVRRREMQIWLPALLLENRRAVRRRVRGPIHLIVCLADHFEPAWRAPSYEVECARVALWRERYPALAGRHADADGLPPQYTFFYPEEQYRPEHLDVLADLRRRRLADVEIHLHHHNDTAEGLREKLLRFKYLLNERHGLLRRNPSTGEIEYGFIHGNWALDNSRRDGICCGVNNELTVLRETGCYADFTLPSAPSDTQTRKINSIYYAVDDPLRPKSHDTGIDVRVGGGPSADLLMVQGPLTLDWGRRLLPKIENGELSADHPPSPRRADLWVRRHIHVKGRPEWVFLKVHIHGANERNAAMLFGGPLDRTLSHLESVYNDGRRYRLHYVTAREMYNIIKSAEAGMEGDPNHFRSFSPERCLV
jgi:hypothetical protein